MAKSLMAHARAVFNALSRSVMKRCRCAAVMFSALVSHAYSLPLSTSMPSALSWRCSCRRTLSTHKRVGRLQPVAARHAAGHDPVDAAPAHPQLPHYRLDADFVEPADHHRLEQLGERRAWFGLRHGHCHHAMSCHAPGTSPGVRAPAGSSCMACVQMAPATLAPGIAGSGLVIRRTREGRVGGGRHVDHHVG